jgi:hypothetical protein
MELGLIPDRTYGAIVQSEWWEGLPEMSWLGSLKPKGKRSYPVVTLRCVSCGYLESYARA